MITPRERVLMAIHHEEPDRVPLFFGADLSTGILIEPYQHLAKTLQHPTDTQYLYDWGTLNAAKMSETLLRHLNVDVRGVQDHFPPAVYEQNSKTLFIDDWGVGHQRVASGGSYASRHPLASAQEVADLDTYPHWPDMHHPERYTHIRPAIRRLADEGTFAIVAAPWMISPLERAGMLQGRQVFLKNMLRRPDFAGALLNNIVQRFKIQLTHFLQATDGKEDIIIIGDDLGVQDGLLFSPQLYRRLLKPVHADLIHFIRQRSSAKIFFHTDGDVYRILDDLVEIGVDILHGVEPYAGEMANLRQLKKRYGQSLCFCGAIDTLHILPLGTPQTVQEEVKRVIAQLGPGGGYLVAPTHALMNTVPTANILALVEAVNRYGHYPLSKA